MKPAYDYGDEVRVTRNVRNDGTFPGREIGDLLIRRGSVGHVRSVGTYLQDQIIYSVHFLEDNLLVGCREEELLSAADPWVPNRFEFRDKVITTRQLVSQGDTLAARGDEGEVIKVVRDNPQGIAYHVRINGRTLMIPETTLEPADPATDDDGED